MSGQINVDVIQTSAGPSLGAGNATLMKNRLINGQMQIDQRNNGASVSAINSYVTDRWAFYGSQASKLTAQQNAGSVTLPVGFTNYLGLTSTSAYSVLSTDTFSIQQQIEGFNFADLGFGTANAKTVTLSFWAYSSLTGTFGGALKNYAGTRSYPFSYSIPVANTWTQISVTIAGDTSGTWVSATNAGAAAVVFGLGSGSTLSNTAGAWASGNYNQPTGSVSVVGTSGATFYITGVQLEVGSSATGFEYRQYQQELALCQRYFYNVGGDQLYAQATTPAPASSTSSAWANVFFPVTMRTTPTFSYSALADWIITQNISGLSISALSIYTNGASSKQAALNATASPASLVVANVYYYAANNTSARLNFNSEL